MPNIEIHGIQNNMKSAELRNEIFETIRTNSVELVSEVVVTEVPDSCVDSALKSQPFLRIISPEKDSEKAEKIIQWLEKALNMDMEIMTIDRFIPHK